MLCYLAKYSILLVLYVWQKIINTWEWWSLGIGERSKAILYYSIDKKNYNDKKNTMELWRTAIKFDHYANHYSTQYKGHITIATRRTPTGNMYNITYKYTAFIPCRLTLVCAFGINTHLDPSTIYIKVFIYIFPWYMNLCIHRYTKYGLVST